MKIWGKLALLAFSIVLDAVQLLVLFEAALCAVPSITGVGVVLTVVCSAFVALGVSLVLIGGVVFAVIWTAAAFILTGRKAALVAGALEIVPVVNTLPIFTASALYLMVKK